MDTKQCTCCKIDLPLTQFGLRKNKPRSRCRKCENMLSKEWRRKNSEKVRAAGRIRNERYKNKDPEAYKKRKHEYYVKHKERMLRQSKQWAKDNPEQARAIQKKSRKKRQARTRDYVLRTKYGITLKEYNNLVDKQGGHCPLCGNVLADNYAVDHCHDTGRVRGVLCRGCNTGVGLLRHDVKVLRNAIKYLSD